MFRNILCKYVLMMLLFSLDCMLGVPSARGSVRGSAPVGSPAWLVPVFKAALPVVPQQSVDSSMCVFYSLANALVSVYKNVYPDKSFEVERLATLFSHLCNHKEGEGVVLSQAYQDLCKHQEERDCQLLQQAVKRYQIISLHINQLNRGPKTEKAKILLERMRYHEQSAIIVFVEDRTDGSEKNLGHVFCLGIDKSAANQIHVYDSVDLAYHHEGQSLRLKQKESQISRALYQPQIIWLRDFLSAKNNRIARYKLEIFQLKKRLQEVTQLLREELLSSS